MFEILKLIPVRDSEVWNLIKICVQLVIWTQPSGPLCLWQCFQNCFIAVNLMIDNRFGRAAGVVLGSLLVIPFLFLEHCFHFLLLEHFHFLVFRLVLFSYHMISFSFSIHYYLHYLIPCSDFVSYRFSFSLLGHFLLSLLDMSLFHFSLSLFHFVFRGCV